TSPDPTTWVEVGAHGATAYHYVEVRGLRPGTTYYWRAESAGRPAVPTMVTPTRPWEGSAPPTFTTLTRPPGKEIGRVAWLNDLHYGEQIAGLAYSHSSLTRGNHDRWESGSTYSSCVDRGAGLRDCFAGEFDAGFVPGTQHFSITFGSDKARYRFVGLDSNDGTTTGVLRQGELDFLEAELK